MTDKSDWWKIALQSPELIGSAELPVHDGHPQAGFYRFKKKDKKTGDIRWLPVKISGDDAMALIGFESDNPRIAKGDAIWTFCCRHPVEEEVYDLAFWLGKWPEDHDKARGSNEALSEDEQLQNEVQELVDRANVLMKKKLQGQSDADQFSNIRSELLKLEKRVESRRKELKQPHIDAGKAVDNIWTPIKDLASGAAARLRSLVQVWMIAEKARLEEVAKKEVAAGEATIEEAAKKATARAGTTGAKRASLRTIKFAKIVDYKAALAHFSKNEKVQELVQKLANQAIKNGGSVPGVEVDTKEELG